MNKNDMTISVFNKSYSSIIVKNNYYFASDALFEKGIGCCCDCGYYVDIGTRWCFKCKSETIILRNVQNIN